MKFLHEFNFLGQPCISYVCYTQYSYKVGNRAPVCYSMGGNYQCRF